MTKTLTEQWKDGTLPIGTYYIVNINGDKEIDKSICIGELWNNPDLKEVLAPVPSYEELKELDSELKELATKNDTLAMENGRLQEQLNEANEVIKFFANSQIGKKNKDGTCGFWLCSGDVAFDNPLERINNKMKYTCYDPRPAKKWLKKWGVK